VTGYIACVLDRDVVVAVAGAVEKKFIDKPISPAAEQVLEERETLVMEEPGAHAFCEGCKEEDEDCKFSVQALAPIITSQGDPLGVVVLSSQEPDDKMGDLEIKLANTAAGFLAKQMEE
jgi:AbrB family transcriptional regulator (stage V sporulation protein T)